MSRRVTAEFLGTALLLAAVVGSGITVGEGQGGEGLFHHAAVVGAALVALILAFGAVSGAHLNPAVTLADAWFGGMDRREVGPYVAAQVAGAVVGTVVTALLFGESAVAFGDNARGGLARVVSEGVATGGLLVVIFGTVRGRRVDHVPYAVGAYVAAAIVFTSSACFANPAVTIGRSLTDTWTGIQLVHVPGFLAGQAIGAVLAIALIGWLFDPTPAEATDVVVPHDTTASST